jgi:hypothetical protein
VAADEGSLFRFNVIADDMSALPSVARLPLRNMMLGGVSDEAFGTQKVLEPDRIEGRTGKALEQIEALVRATCFVRLTTPLESEAPTVLTPTRRT